MGNQTPTPRSSGPTTVVATPEAPAELPLSRLIATSDVALVLGPDGRVRDVSFGDPDMARRLDATWVGRPLAEVVTPESRGKVERLLATAPEDPLAWHEINHPIAGGDLPVRYAALRLSADGPVFALGRDLGALARLQQQLVDANLSIERDYALYRSAETQARLLFQTSAEPMLILDAATRRVLDSNAAAEDLLRRTGRRLAGVGLDEVFAPRSVEAMAECLAAVRALGQGRAESVALRLTDTAVAVAGWLMRGGGTPQVLLRLLPPAAEAGPSARDAWVALRTLPEAMLMAGADLSILDANDAFLDLVDAPTVHQLRAESLSRFVGRHGVDIDVLSARLQEAGAVRRYATVLRGQFGALREVEVSAGATGAGDERTFAFLFRPTAVERPPEARRPLRPVGEMTELVGRVPLRDIVREATDIIEELCIEAALDVTGDNRASAAEMLGLSRQSLYSKLRRYGLGDLPGEGVASS